MRAHPHLAAGLALAGVVVLALAQPARGADVEGAVDGELGTGVDSNPARVLGASGTTDGFVSARLRGTGTATGDRFALAGQLTEAGRLYATVGEATAVGSRLDASARYALSDSVSAGVALLASDLTERGHRLDQDLLDGVASIAWSGGGWKLRGDGGWSLFAPREASLRPFLSSGPRAAAVVEWELVRGDLVAGSYEFAAPSYPRWRDTTGEDRADRTHTVAAELVHRGSFLAAVGYAYTWNRSSAAGGAFDRHRVHARAAAYVLGDLTVAGRASLQWSSYPQPLFLAQQLLLSDGQQNLDSVELRLTHPLRGPLELALAVALYRAEAAVAPGEVPSFTRTVASFAIGWRGQWSSTIGTP